MTQPDEPILWPVDPSAQWFDEINAAVEAGDQARVDAAVDQLPEVTAKVRRLARLRAVPVNGDRALGRRMGYFETTLRDGTIGYFQRRSDDCLQAALATLTQCPMDQVPDLHLDKQERAGRDPEQIAQYVAWRMGAWARDHGVIITAHATLPTTSKRWIGVSWGGGETGDDHCLVLNRKDVLWDPSHELPPGEGDPMVKIAAYGPDHINYGITIGG